MHPRAAASRQLPYGRLCVQQETMRHPCSAAMSMTFLSTLPHPLPCRRHVACGRLFFHPRSPRYRVGVLVTCTAARGASAKDMPRRRTLPRFAQLVHTPQRHKKVAEVEEEEEGEEEEEELNFQSLRVCVYTRMPRGASCRDSTRCCNFARITCRPVRGLQTAQV